MPDFANLFMFGLVALGMVLTPGPNMIYLISRSISQGHTAGLISLGGTHAAMLEANDRLREGGIAVDYLRIRGFPFSATVAEFIDAHESVFVVEQNRDAQLRSMIAIETGVPRDRMNAVLDYHGLPLTADVVVRAVAAKLGGPPKKEPKSARKGAAV